MNTQKNNEKSDVALREEEILTFWKENDIFNKTVETPAGKKPEGDFVFYDGPPFATGTPHHGHILAGTIKDAIPRFWTMNGKRVVRKWGWDCHGLPLENLIEKRLGLATKRDIEELGIKEFNETAREAVMEYADDWKEIVPRMGRFVDMEDDYRTMDSSYTESVWWVFSELNRKGLVYEGFKSMHLCPRCGTTLSNFEVNQGYKDIKDIAVFVKLKLIDEENTSLLIWTTTPWTLPGNMAAAVHEDIIYVRAKVAHEADGEITTEVVIIAKEILEKYPLHEHASGQKLYVLSNDIWLHPFEEIKGSELVGKSYEPPFDYWQKKEFENKENAWKIYHADYVEIGEEGTGAVHLAPAYGDEDMKLAQEHNIPIIHHVGEDGRFLEFITDFAGQLVKPKDDDSAEVTHLDADIEVLKKLKERDVLFKKEKVTHSYPHCWRCHTPLLNYGTTSWFVKVTDLKKDLIQENNKVKWVPEHVGKNRFGKWLDGARDWAVSRQRYWGAPLPIWRTEGSDEYKIFGSRDEMLEYVPKSGNKYLTMRHGQSESNVAKIISCNKDNADGLTEEGRTQAKLAAEELNDIDLIIHSGFERTKETAEIVAERLGDIEMLEDDRIRELDLSDNFEGQSWSAYNDNFPIWSDRFTKVLKGSENRRDAQIRTGEFISDLESKYSDKKILIVSHAGTLFALECAAKGLNVDESKKYFDEKNVYHANAEVRELPFVSIPYNDNYEFDFHRPYIDDIELVDENGTKMKRIPDVFDCWFESGSMPYGQHHYPFENKEEFLKNKYPAQFIAEGLDQTRGWFYSLIVLGTALFGKSPYENVIVNGTILAEDGQKMSKSLQNYPDPLYIVQKYGADTMRFYLLSSQAMRAEDFSFSEKEVSETQRKNIGRLHNVLAMYEMFADGTVEASHSSTNVLDRWMISRLNEVTAQVTEGYKKYELDKATRPLVDLIDDLSVWYLRRSRDRLKGTNEEDKNLCLGTLRHVLKTLSLLMAPVMPFYAEYLFLHTREENDAESVHLAGWPEASPVDEDIINGMKEVRRVVTEALEIRSKGDLKVRQPLKKLSFSSDVPSMGSDLFFLLQDEVNVKEVEKITSTEGGVMLDTEITPELKREGEVRELIRAIQSARKEKGLDPQDEITLSVDKRALELIEGFEDMIKGIVGATKINESEGNSNTLKLDDEKLSFSIKQA